MPESTHLVGYADEFAAVIIARNIVDEQIQLNQVILKTRLWLEEHGIRT